MTSPFEPDLSERPYAMEVSRLMRAKASDLYEAWTSRFDRWFAQAGELIMQPREGTPFFFYTRLPLLRKR